MVQTVLCGSHQIHVASVFHSIHFLAHTCIQQVTDPCHQPPCHDYSGGLCVLAEKKKLSNWGLYSNPYLNKGISTVFHRTMPYNLPICYSMPWAHQSSFLLYTVMHLFVRKGYILANIVYHFTKILMNNTKLIWAYVLTSIGQTLLWKKKLPLPSGGSSGGLIPRPLQIL